MVDADNLLNLATLLGQLDIEPSERTRAVEVNLAAVERLGRISCWSEAAKFALTAVRLLPEAALEQPPLLPLARRAYVALADAEYRTGDLAAMREHLLQLFQHEKDPAVFLPFAANELADLVREGLFSRALEHARLVTDRLFPGREIPAAESFETHYAEIMRLLAGRSYAEALSERRSPTAADLQQRMFAELLEMVSPLCLRSAPALWMAVIAAQVSMALKFGTGPWSSYAAAGEERLREKVQAPVSARAV